MTTAHQAQGLVPASQALCPQNSISSTVWCFKWSKPCMTLVSLLTPLDFKLQGSLSASSFIPSSASCPFAISQRLPCLSRPSYHVPFRLAPSSLLQMPITHCSPPSSLSSHGIRSMALVPVSLIMTVLNFHLASLYTFPYLSSVSPFPVFLKTNFLSFPLL